jgi:hypothetical protein
VDGCFMQWHHERGVAGHHALSRRPGLPLLARSLSLITLPDE